MSASLEGAENEIYRGRQAINYMLLLLLEKERSLASDLAFDVGISTKSGANSKQPAEAEP